MSGRRSEKNTAKQKTELGKILAEIVSNEANKLRTERREFYHRLVHDGADARGLVRALIKELEISLNEIGDLVRDVRRLEANISQVRVGTIPEYQREICDLKL